MVGNRRHNIRVVRKQIDKEVSDRLASVLFVLQTYGKRQRTMHFGGFKP